jgi:hypothetical protein
MLFDGIRMALSSDVSLSPNVRYSNASGRVLGILPSAIHSLSDIKTLISPPHMQRNRVAEKDARERKEDDASKKSSSPAVGVTLPQALQPCGELP